MNTPIQQTAATLWHSRLLYRVAQMTDGMGSLVKPENDQKDSGDDETIRHIRSRTAEDIGHIILAAYSDGCTVQIVPNDTGYEEN